MEDAFAPQQSERDAQNELVERCIQGDALALREVYQTHRQAVYGVVARMLSNDADRDEVVQDVFLQVFKSITGFKGTSKLSTWIHRVAVNVTLQHIRKKGRRIKLHFKDEMPETASAHEDRPSALNPEQEIARKDKEAAVRRALDTLSPKKRAVLVLADFEGMTSQEISDVVGASALTVRTRLFYARKAFYDKLRTEPAFADVPGIGGAK